MSDKIPETVIWSYEPTSVAQRGIRKLILNQLKHLHISRLHLNASGC